MEIGARLKEARLAKGLTLEDVEAETKIRRKYISALEEEQFDVLPGKVYAKAFLKTYTKFLGVDLGVDVLFPKDIFMEDSPLERNEPLFAPPPPKQSRATGFFRRVLIGLVVIAGLAVILVVGSWLVGTNLANRAQEPGNGSNEPGTGVSDPVEERPPVEQPPAVVYDELNLDFNIKNRPCWMLVVVDGTEEYQGTLQPGETKHFQGKEKILVRFGDAGAVEAVQNGVNLGMMSDSSEVIEREFNLGNDG